MNFGDILTRYESRTGAPVTRSYLSALIDEAQIEIAKRYGERSREEFYSVERGEEYDLPSDHLRTEEVRDGDKRLVSDYQITSDGMIMFPADGDYTLIYTRMPRLINSEDNDSEPDVHSMFHGMIVQYCVAKWWEDHSEGIPAEEAKAERMMNEFYRKVDEAAHVLKQRAFANRRMGIHPIVRGY